MDALRAGLIGCGAIGRNHAATLDQLGEEIVAVADIDPDARESVAADFGVSDTYEDYERMIAESDLDLVVVAVPNALHPDCAVAALDADLDVFVEKPLAATLEGARRIERAAADSDGRGMVGYVKVFDPVFEAGVHALHLALAVLDFPDVETVSAVTGANFGTRDDYTYLSMWGGDPEPDPEFSTEDYARALVRTADETALHLHCTWAGNTDPRKNVRLQGTEAGLTVTENDDSDPTLYGTDRGALTDTALQHPDGGPFERQWSYFADVVRGERNHTRNTVAEGVAVQRLVEAVYESADEGGEVQLD